MSAIFDWLLNHYNIVVSIVSMIVAIVVFIVKKKPITSIYADLYEVSLDACIEAEKTAYKGSEKLNWAITYACSKLKAIYPEIRPDKYMTLIGFIIERILCTPHKKGG